MLSSFLRSRFFITVLLSLTALSASATTYTLQPGDADLADLDHYKAYKWRINKLIPDDEEIVGATLFFDNIRNWDNNANILHLSLLNRSGGNAGTNVYSDNQFFSNYFAGNASFVSIGYLSGFNTQARDVTFDLSGLATQTLNQGTLYSAGNVLGSLSSYMADGYFALGFDPDCHYWNDGITLTITTAPVPEGANSLGLAGLGFGLLILFRRLRK